MPLRTWMESKRNILVMLACVLVLGMAEELWTRFVPKYLELLGATAWIIAIYGTLKDLLDAVYQYPGGWLADRIGRKNSLLLFTFLSMIGYLVYLLAGSWLWILIGTFLVMAWSSLTLPALFAIIGDHLPATSRATGFGVQSIIKRIPIIVAPAIGGLWIARSGLSDGMKGGLMVAIALAILALYIIRRFYSETLPERTEGIRILDLWRQLHPRLKQLLISDVLARWAEGIPKVFVVLYVMNILKLNAFQFGWLTSIQMIASILFYLPLSRVADRFERKPLVFLTFVFFALFPLSVVLSHSFSWLILAFVIGGLREVGEPARKAVIVDLAAANLRGRTVGLYYLIRGLIVFPASLLGGWLWTLDPTIPFYTAFVIGVVGALYYLRSRDGRATLIT
ncbi:MFS transporter [bacterium]|nr:MFS transporter [bacterium]